MNFENLRNKKITKKKTSLEICQNLVKIKNQKKGKSFDKTKMNLSTREDINLTSSKKYSFGKEQVNSKVDIFETRTDLFDRLNSGQENHEINCQKLKQKKTSKKLKKEKKILQTFYQKFL